MPEFTAAGYHSIFSGQKTYNGVALLSRHPMTEVLRDIPDFDDPPRRVLAATIVGPGIPRHQPVRAERPGAGLREVRVQAQWLEALTRWLKTKRRPIPASWCWATSTSRPKTVTYTTRPLGWAACT